VPDSGFCGILPGAATIFGKKRSRIRPPSLAVDKPPLARHRRSIERTAASLPRPGTCEAPPLRRLAFVFLAMFAAQAAGSAFNIAYNLAHLPPLLTSGQEERLAAAIQIYNFAAYPLLAAVWAFSVFRLARPARDRSDLERLQRLAVHLPLRAGLIAAIGWVGSLIALLGTLHLGPEPLDPQVNFHLPLSIGVAMTIALVIGFFLIHALVQNLLFPVLFTETSPARLEGAFRISIVARGWLVMLAASICPILALLLLFLSPASGNREDAAFAIAVAAVGIFCALVSGALLSRLVHRPVEELRRAAQEVGAGRLNLRVDHLRADEFGILADEFNRMVSGLRERERIATTFGRHVGREIADYLLEDESQLLGRERWLSVLFADIRGFTTRCENLPPERVVKLLNLYHTHTTALIEREGGIVNQLVGDGLMALFGATRKHLSDEGGALPGDEAEPSARETLVSKGRAGANDAVRAGIAMIEGLRDLNATLAAEGFDPVRIGVGIHTGRAVIGTIGSPRRMEFTAIGDTVNTTARIEAMTKEVGAPLLVSSATWEAAAPKPRGRRLEPMQVRGREGSIVLYAVETRDLEKEVDR